MYNDGKSRNGIKMLGFEFPTFLDFSFGMYEAILRVAFSRTI